MNDSKILTACRSTTFVLAFSLVLSERLFSAGLAIVVDPSSAGVDSNSASVGTILQGIADQDGDGVVDNLDNCLVVANPSQRDSDGNGIGNFCDSDLNNDCVTNVLDLGIMKTELFGSDPDADLNGDGIVNFVDFAMLSDFAYEPPGPSGIFDVCD